MPTSARALAVATAAPVLHRDSRADRLRAQSARFAERLQRFTQSPAH